MQNEKQESKQSYEKPEITKHGKVEELTQIVSVGGCSAPCSGPPPIIFFPIFGQNAK